VNILDSELYFKIKISAIELISKYNLMNGQFPDLENSLLQLQQNEKTRDVAKYTLAMIIANKRIEHDEQHEIVPIF
jgi:hypothetical protein